MMVFIETSVFTRQIRDLISDDHLGVLQEWIATSPASGDLIKGSRGCRKLRWRTDDLSQAQIKMLGEIVKLEIRWIEDGRKTV